MGMVHEVVDPADLEQRALALAEELLTIPFTALLHTKRQIDNAFEQSLDVLKEQLAVVQADCLQSPEHATVMEQYREEQALRQAQKEQK